MIGGGRGVGGAVLRIGQEMENGRGGKWWTVETLRQGKWMGIGQDSQLL